MSVVQRASELLAATHILQARSLVPLPASLPVDQTPRRRARVSTTTAVVIVACVVFTREKRTDARERCVFGRCLVRSRRLLPYYCIAPDHAGIETTTEARGLSMGVDLVQNIRRDDRCYT